eukprot:CAMPEP_0119271416 /NCGR_PEP_ID=MMETSP1329-20130426/8016_1 /TAXON_ID=114041 /ORGANISM="Genus nov. species nov., Strain RCC1024" /LENGTH=65 /DNA_ID=CAMNT_0007271465 /DNA_START=343 /DNA_END=536 /DNA_ORIENTATION=+
MPLVVELVRYLLSSLLFAVVAYAFGVFDALAQRYLERSLTDALGTRATVDAVAVDALAGTVEARG